SFSLLNGCQVFPPSWVTRIVPLPPHARPNSLFLAKLTSRIQVRMCSRTVRNGAHWPPLFVASVPNTPTATSRLDVKATESNILKLPLEMFVHVPPLS